VVGGMSTSRQQLASGGSAREAAEHRSPRSIGAVGAGTPGRREAGGPPGAASRRRGHPTRPKHWPRAATQFWAWRAHDPGPLVLLVTGAHGGVGTTTLTALLAETLAAASPWPTLAVDQSGTPLAALSRRLLGQPAGIAAPVLAHQAHTRGGLHALRDTVSSPAGALLVDDRRGYTPLGLITGLISNGGTCVIDAGRTDPTVTARAGETAAHTILTGRGDLAGAEAVCAQLALLRHTRTPVHPIVALTSTSPGRRRVAAAMTLVRSAGVTDLVHLPYDHRHHRRDTLRLEHTPRRTLVRVLQLLAHITRRQEARRAR
jgi:Mrp family chromosome partitioning ATPase